MTGRGTTRQTVPGLPVVRPPFADVVDRGLAAAADHVTKWFADAFGCPVAMVRRGPAGGVVVRPGTLDCSRWTQPSSEPPADGAVVVDDDSRSTCIQLGSSPFALVLEAPPPTSELEFYALELACAGLALQTAESTDQVKSLRRELSGLHAVANKILALRDLNQVLLSIANEILSVLDADMAGVLLLTEDDQLEMGCCVGNLSVETARLTMAKGRGLAGRVLETGQPCKVDQYLKSDSITHDFDLLAVAERTRSALGAPLAAHGEVIGVLEVWRRRRAPFSDADQERLVALTNLASIAIENARLFDQTHEGLRLVAETEQALNVQVETLQRAAEIHHSLSRLLLEGEGLPSIARAVSKELGAEVAIISHEMWHLASHPRDLSLADIRSDVVRLTQRMPKGVGSTTMASRPGWLTVGSIDMGSDPFGWICVLAHEPPSPITEIVINSAVMHAALWHLQARAAEQANVEAIDKTLWDLLDGTDEHRHTAAARALQMRIDLRKPHRVFVGRFHGLSEYVTDQGWTVEQGDTFRRSLHAKVRRILAQLTGAELVGARADIVAAIVPDTRDVHTVLATLQSGLGNPSQLAPRWGVSLPRSNPSELGTAHSEARGALHVAGRLGGQRSAVFDELGMLRFLVGPNDDTDLSRFVNEVIGPLITADRARNGELLATLRGYLEANCSQAEAAQRLFVHHKTMRYRLERIQQLTGLDLHLHNDRVRADLALRIHELGRGNGPASISQGHQND